MATDSIITIDEKPGNHEKKTIPELSFETGVLTERIGRMTPGELVEYDEFSKICGRNVRTVAASSMQSARRRAITIHEVCCECVRTVGYRRLIGNDLVSAQSAGTKRIHNEAKRRVKKLKIVRFDELDATSKNTMNALLSVYGVISHATKTKSFAMLENKIADSAEPLPIGRTMELFQGK